MHLDLPLPSHEVSPEDYTLFTQEYYSDPTITRTDPRRLAVKMCCLCVTHAWAGREEIISEETLLPVQEVQNLLEFCANKLNLALPKI